MQLLSLYCSITTQWWLDKILTPSSSAVVDCGPPTLLNGTFTLVSGSTTFNSMARYECSAGFKLIGSDTSTCTEDGEWEGSSSRFCRGVWLLAVIHTHCVRPTTGSIIPNQTAALNSNAEQSRGSHSVVWRWTSDHLLSNVHASIQSAFNSLCMWIDYAP